MSAVDSKIEGGGKSPDAAIPAGDLPASDVRESAVTATAVTDRDVPWDYPAADLSGAVAVALQDKAEPEVKAEVSHADAGSSRRGFLRRLALGAARVAAGSGVLGGFMGLRSGHATPAGARGALGIVRPPGSLEDEHDFLAQCVRCTRCADACPAQCIRLFGPEAGALQGTPYIVPAERGCTMCFECGPACPSSAIGLLKTMPEAKMGVAVVDERLCVSHNGTGVCGACHTICPLKNRAILQNYRNAPEVNEDLCTGCGLCEDACIVRDRRAIRVQSPRVLAEFRNAEATE